MYRVGFGGIKQKKKKKDWQQLLAQVPILKRKQKESTHCCLKPGVVINPARKFQQNQGAPGLSLVTLVHPCVGTIGNVQICSTSLHLKGAASLQPSGCL